MLEGLGMVDWSAVEFECAERPVELKVKPFRSCAEIKARVAKRYRITVADLEGPCRRREFAYPRIIAMALAYRKLRPFGYSTTMVGKHFGGRDHSTVIHACRKFRKGQAGAVLVMPYHTQRHALEARASA